jgi:hypothetical protein
VAGAAWAQVQVQVMLPTAQVQVPARRLLKPPGQLSESQQVAVELRSPSLQVAPGGSSQRHAEQAE